MPIEQTLCTTPIEEQTDNMGTYFSSYRPPSNHQNLPPIDRKILVAEHDTGRTMGRHLMQYLCPKQGTQNTPRWQALTTTNTSMLLVPSLH